MNVAERILEECMKECLRGMTSTKIETRQAWYYTHCGEIEMTEALGHISAERKNELLDEWRKHNPTIG